MNNIRNNNEIDTAAMAEIVEEIVARVNEDPEAFLRLNSIRDMDNYTFLHSVDVCIYSIILGKSKGINGKDLVKLGLGAMLHDVGKSRVPSEILLKPGMLDEDEFEEMKKHTIFGYEIICNSPRIDKTIADMAHKHHERWDGKGYPFGLRGSELDLYSKIVTICDIYDALTADRVYRGRILPHEAAEYIVNNEMIITDPELTKHFVENVAIYPVGATVLLSTGEIGRISRIDRSMPLRPVIDIFSHRDTDKRISGHRLNLMENLTVFIVDIIG